MKVGLLLVSLVCAEMAFYGRVVELSSGEIWRIVSKEEAGVTACDDRCGDACLQVAVGTSFLGYLMEDRTAASNTLISCLEFCGCQGTAGPAETTQTQVEVTPSADEISQSQTDSPTLSCSQQCDSVCESQSPSCLSKCNQDFCSLTSDDEKFSILLPVIVDLAVLVLLLGMFYFAYVYTPKKQKRGAYWRKRIMEAQYTRLDDY